MQILMMGKASFIVMTVDQFLQRNVEVTGAARLYRAASGGPQGYASFVLVEPTLRLVDCSLHYLECIIGNLEGVSVTFLRTLCNVNRIS